MKALNKAEEGNSGSIEMAISVGVVDAEFCTCFKRQKEDGNVAQSELL
jgi:hypothetical protein